MARTPLRVAVVILAVAESPGRRFSGGSCSVTTTLKSFASWLAEVCCEVETPVERTMALLPISVTTALNVFLGIASMLTSAGWPSLHVDDVGFVHLDFGGDDGHVGQSHERAARRILDADDDGLAFPHRQVRDHAVVGRGVGGLLQHVGGVRQVGAVLRDVAIGGVLLRLGLRNARLGLRQSGLRRLPGSFLAVEFRLGDQRVFEQTLRPGPIQLGAFEVGLRAVQVGRGRIQRRGGGDGIGLGCVDAKPGVAFTSAEDCTFSSCASNWPFLTRSPSLT